MKFKSKITDYLKLKRHLSKSKKKVVLCHGVFDLLHVGHLRYFEEAKKFGDILVVSVTSDKYIFKGPGRPRFSTNIRMECVASVGVVDHVIESDSETPEKIIKLLRPSYYVKGKDYKNLKSDITKKIFLEKKIVNQNGGKLVFTNSEKFSSSNILLDSDISLFNIRQKNFISSAKSELKNLRKKNFEQYLDKIRKLKVLVIGETIIDKYVFCETVGKSGKEPMLVMKENKKNFFVGGAAAVASQLSGFSKNVTFLSYIGQKNEYLDRINKSLKKINKIFIKKNNSSTILKTRYVDEASRSKLLGVYNLNDEPLSSANEKKLNQYLKKNIKKFDLVVVSDYGHGFISQKTSKLIAKNSKFISINCQINANNKGHHSTIKYSNLDCVLINETELRYEMRDNHTIINSLVKNFCKKIRSKFIIVTRGNEGCLLYDKRSDDFINCPAFATMIADKVGAGDSLLSVFSIMFYYTRSIRLSLFAGSLSASMSLRKFGNDKEINLNNLMKIFSHIF